MKKLSHNFTSRNTFIEYSLVFIYTLWKVIAVSISVYFLIKNDHPWLAIGIVIIYLIIKFFEGTFGDTDLDDTLSISYKVIRLKNMLTDQNNPIQELKIQQDIELLQFRKDQLLVLKQLKKSIQQTK